MNIISKWFWKRAVRRELLFAAKPIAWVSGALFVISGIVGATSLILGLILGVGVTLLASQLKHRLWSAAFLIAGLVVYTTLGGATDKWGAVLIVVASTLGLASTFV